MSGFLNREQAQAEEKAEKTKVERLEAENADLKLRVEMLEGLLENYAVRQVQLEEQLLVVTAKEEAMRGEPSLLTERKQPPAPLPYGHDVPVGEGR